MSTKALPVVPSTNGLGTPLTVVSNGFGIPVIKSPNGIGLPVVANQTLADDTVYNAILGGGIQALSDIVAEASYAYGFVSLNTAYTGAVVRIREDDGDTEEDFTAAEVAAGDIATFLADSNDADGFITTFYDQSGNGVDLVQTTDANQPQYTNEDSLHWATFNGTTGTMNTDAAVDLTGTNELTLAFGEYENNTSTGIFYEQGPSLGSTTPGAIIYHADVGLGVIKAGFYTAGGWREASFDVGDPPALSVYDITMTIGTGVGSEQINIIRNGASVASGNNDSGTPSGNFGDLTHYFGARGGSSLFFIGRMTSFILWPRILTDSERTIVRAVINEATGAY